MSYKPDEATLVAYLYGELDIAEQRLVEDYLLHHPEEKKRVEEWSTARTILSELPDKEVIAPPVILGEPKSIPLWKERSVRMSLGIAASMVFFLVAARLLGLSASYVPGELKIGFGVVQKVVPSSPALTKQEVDEMIRTSLQGNNSALQASWSEDRKVLEQSLQKNLRSNTLRIDQLMQTASLANQDQVKQFVGQLQSDNLKLMKDYMQLSTAGQKEYIENLLVDFSSYLAEQRKQDLQLLQARVNKVEKNTDQFKQETEEILTSLITNTSTNNQRRN